MVNRPPPKDYLICVARQVSRIATKHIEDLATVVIAGWYLAVRVVVALAARPRKPLDLVALGLLNQAEVRAPYSAS